ncbi:MAG: glycosyltransferase family 9 protein [Nitrospiria bacterium]
MIRRGHRNPLPLPSPPASLCLLRFSALGDVCHTVPVVRTLQAAWPKTRLTWVIGKLEAQLAGDLPGVEFVIFDKSGGWSEYRRLRRRMRRRRFDVLLHMQTSMRANLASLMIPADIRLGFDRARAKDYQSFFVTDQITAEPGQHVMDGFFGFLKALGLKERLIQWDLPLSLQAEATAKAYLPGDQPVLVISPCASPRFRNFRNWHVEGYAAVADYAVKKHGFRVVLIGAPTPVEKMYGKRILELAASPVTNLIGKTSLKELLAFLKRATLVIAPDSGPAHIATAAGTPVIGLYATTNPARARPYLSEPWLVNRYPEAVRTFLGKNVDDVPWGTRVRREEAMSLIKVKDVTEKLDQFVGGVAP